MPSFRGIDISILAPSEVGKLPEYPHSEGASVQLGARKDNTQCPSQVSTVNPTISVYIPSVPGAQFCINYVVEREPSPPSHLFFKLFMNGRHITSWGINPKVRDKGRVEKALYEPSDQWNHEEDGATMKPEGIEARYFHFIGGQEKRSVAEDGGLIEILVFRARGRKRRAAKLDRYRHQDKYGIAAPSGGLLDNPQDVTFFDFHLIDPRDEPFASFRFHYRSLSNLRQLNLVPFDDSNVFDKLSTSTFTDSIDLTPDANIYEPPVKKAPNRSPGFRHDPDESVFDDNSSSSEGQLDLMQGGKPQKEKAFVLRPPPQLRPGPGASHNLPQPSKHLRDGSTEGIPDSYLQRPLPDRPLPDLPIGVSNEACGPLRKTSTASIATSLLSYVKDGSFLDESVEYGHAQEVPVYKANKDGLPPHHHHQRDPDNLSVSDYEGYLSSEDDFKVKQSQPAPLDRYTGSIENKLNNCMGVLDIKNRSSSAKDAKATGPKASTSAVNIGEKCIDFSRFPHLQLDEYEWIRRSPSPKVSPHRALSPRLGRLWGTLRRGRSRSPLRQPSCEAPIRNFSTPHLPGQGGNEKYGNWI